MNEERIEVIPGLCGGLGNQMFQIAMAHVFARQVDGVVGIDETIWRSLGQGCGTRHYRESLFSRLRRTSLRADACVVHEEQWKPGQKPVLNVPRATRQILLKGCWQLPALWDREHQEIRDLFHFDANRSTRSGVHFRGGDYPWDQRQTRDAYHCQPGPRYYDQAIANLSDSPDFYTDDPVRLNRVAPGLAPVQGSETEHFSGMANCAELVLSKSTFAWWAAFLGNVPFVIMPAAWFWQREYQPSWAMRIEGWEVFSPNSLLWSFHRWHRAPSGTPELPSGTIGMTHEEWAPWVHPTEILNDLACLIGARSYLEIGCGEGANFRAVECLRKIAIDTAPDAYSCDAPLLRMTPEEFFETNREPFDLIFISGFADAVQIGRILQSAHSTLSGEGVLVCDGLKATGAHWREWLALRMQIPGREFLAVDTGNGIGMILPPGSAAEPAFGSGRGHFEEHSCLLPPERAKRLVDRFMGHPRWKSSMNGRASVSPGRETARVSTKRPWLSGLAAGTNGGTRCSWRPPDFPSLPGMEGNQLDFHVRDGRLHLTGLCQYESRGECCLEMLHRLVAGWPELLEGREGSIYFGDWPPPDALARKELNFCTTTRVGHSGPWLPFPCFASLRWPEIGVPDAEAMLEEILVDERPWNSSKIFWIGTDQHPSRRALWEMGRQNPEIMDVEMIHWNRSDPKKLVSNSRQVSIPDHRKFKYLIDCQGQGYSARLKWLLATGRPVFIVDREIVEPWHLELLPWVHFVPVAADLSDLVEHYARLEHDQNLYAEIARNARNFTAEWLALDVQLDRIARML